MKKIFVFLFALAIFFRISAQIPVGYYDAAAGLSGLPLKTALFNIIKNHTTLSYTPGLWTAFQTTDVKPNGKVWDVYSDVPGGTPPYEYTFVTNQCGSYNSEGDCYNREHSLPESWFAGASPMYSDLFHIYPTDGKVNGVRSNFPLADVGSASTTSLNGSKLGTCSDAGYTGTVFEPIDEYKGDFARSYFYMATCYQNLIATWYNNSTEANAVLSNNSGLVFETWYINTLLAWDTNDPVSPKEVDRNNAIYTVQNNRNPYIDHPEWVLAIWGPTAGIRTTDVSDYLSLYPMPAKESITINLNRADLDIKKVELYTLASGMLQSYPVAGKSVTIKLNDYAAGVYFVSIFTNNEVIQKKIVVVK